MSPSPDRIRILLLADSHLGFDHPPNPRIRRRRRGEDFLANHEHAFELALEQRVDIVVHGGDVFHRPDVQPSLVHQAFAPMKRVAEAGIPVFLTPGNHERSRIPFDWLARHQDVHVFGEPDTVVTRIRGHDVAVSGVPCLRRDARSRFKAAVEQTGWRQRRARLRLLVTHQAFEGATVGPADFTFRHGPDVVRLRDVPAEFAAVLSGHIHRCQALDSDLSGRPAAVPVFYPGSIERTAFAERDEVKGFLMLDAHPSEAGGQIGCWTFHDLRARPMRVRGLRVRGLGPVALERELREALSAEPKDAVLRLEADGAPRSDAAHVLSAARLRALAPPSMNVAVVVPGVRRWTGRRKPSRSTAEGGVQRTLFENP